MERVADMVRARHRTRLSRTAHGRRHAPGAGRDVPGDAGAVQARGGGPGAGPAVRRHRSRWTSTRRGRTSRLTHEHGHDREPARVLEALLFVSDEPVSAARLAKVMEIPEAAVASPANLRCGTSTSVPTAASSCARSRADGACTRTPPTTTQSSSYVLSWDTRRLSQAALEALAVIAYHQPVTRAGVNAVRGVNCEGVVASLVEKGLVREAGRDKTAGNAILYGTTQDVPREVRPEGPCRAAAAGGVRARRRDRNGDPRAPVRRGGRSFRGDGCRRRGTRGDDRRRGRRGRRRRDRTRRVGSAGAAARGPCRAQTVLGGVPPAELRAARPPHRVQRGRRRCRRSIAAFLAAGSCRTEPCFESGRPSRPHSPGAWHPSRQYRIWYYWKGESVTRMDKRLARIRLDPTSWKEGTDGRLSEGRRGTGGTAVRGRAHP